MASQIGLILIFDDFSQFHSNCVGLHYEKLSNTYYKKAKNEEKRVRLSFNPFLHRTAGSRNPSFGYPFGHYFIW